MGEFDNETTAPGRTVGPTVLRSWTSETSCGVGPATPATEAPIYIGGITLTPIQVEQAFSVLQARRKEEEQRKWDDEQIVNIQVTRALARRLGEYLSYFEGFEGTELTGNESYDIRAILRATRLASRD